MNLTCPLCTVKNKMCVEASNFGVITHFYLTCTSCQKTIRKLTQEQLMRGLKL